MWTVSYWVMQGQIGAIGGFITEERDCSSMTNSFEDRLEEKTTPDI